MPFTEFGEDVAHVVNYTDYYEVFRSSVLWFFYNSIYYGHCVILMKVNFKLSVFSDGQQRKQGFFNVASFPTEVLKGIFND